MESSKNSLLDVKDLACRIGPTNVLRSCSIEVRKGELVCVLGRNGAGKSSILKSIIGLYPAQRGAIVFNGRDITRLPSHERVAMGIAYAPEDSRMFPELSVEENISLGFWVKRAEGRARRFDLEKACTIFPALRKLLKRKSGTLSGGEKKMVSISRALSLDPVLVLLDESFEGLSPLVVAAFSEAMEAIRDDLGVSILLAESNLHNASQVAERAYIIDRGEIIFEGPPQAIREDERLMKLVGK